MTKHVNDGSPNEPVKPWHHQPWFWFLASIPLASIVLSSIMVTVAVRGKDTLVSDDYYKDGLEINQEHARGEQAHALGLAAVMTINAEQERLSITLSSTEPVNDPLLILKLIHPTIGDNDHLLQLQRVGDHYEGLWPADNQGRWYLDLRDTGNQWRLRGQLSLPSDSPVSLTDGIE